MNTRYLLYVISKIFLLYFIFCLLCYLTVDLIYKDSSVLVSILRILKICICLELPKFSKLFFFYKN
jgi:hypothetical protein